MKVIHMAGLIRKRFEGVSRFFNMFGGGAFLPIILQEIEKVAGFDAAVKVAFNFGGMRLCFPKENFIDENHRLSELVGLDAAQKICKELGGITFTIPIGPFNRSAILFYKYSKLSNLGWSKTEIARELGVHVRTVFHWYAITKNGGVSKDSLVAFGKAIGDEWDADFPETASAAPGRPKALFRENPTTDFFKSEIKRV